MMGRSHDEYMIERFQADPDFAASLVNDILEDGDDQGELKVILEWIAAAGLQMQVTPKANKANPAKRTRVVPGKKGARPRVTAPKRAKAKPAAKRARPLSAGRVRVRVAAATA